MWIFQRPEAKNGYFLVSPCREQVKFLCIHFFSPTSNLVSKFQPNSGMHRKYGGRLFRKGFFRFFNDIMFSFVSCFYGDIYSLHIVTIIDNILRKMKNEFGILG